MKIKIYKFVPANILLKNYSKEIISKQILMHKVIYQGVAVIPNYEKQSMKYDEINDGTYTP